MSVPHQHVLPVKVYRDWLVNNLRRLGVRYLRSACGVSMPLFAANPSYRFPDLGLSVWPLRPPFDLGTLGADYHTTPQ